MIQKVHVFFFFVSVSVRKRLYGDYFARIHDPKWDSRVLFGVGVVAGHWGSVGIWVLIVVTMLYSLRLNAVVVPTAVVLLCDILHRAACAFLSPLFLVAVCLVYYNKKAKLQEELIMESFGQSYLDYVDKPVVADAASLRFTSEVVSFVFASPSENKGFFSNGNLDDAASAYTWLLVL
ncbi:hypothetical protein HID58_045915 [Brassica napus]|uniref:Uncharacterized protein n=2 Tax=Brassica napus TaxID=3708 RepID=A0ABQ8AVK7_BRANA|nr:hypothetical protein HID58_045915 [Brassica napus]